MIFSAVESVQQGAKLGPESLLRCHASLIRDGIRNPLMFEAASRLGSLIDTETWASRVGGRVGWQR